MIGDIINGTMAYKCKKRAKIEAQEIVDNLKKIAITESLDEIWFIEEVVKNIHNIKEDKE